MSCIDAHSTMSSTHQPLLHSNVPHQTNPYCKFLFFTISITTLFLLLLLSNYNHHLSSPSHLCRRALNPKTCQQFVSEQSYNGTTTHLLQTFLIKHSHLINKASKHFMHEINESGPASDCLELLDQSADLVLGSIKALENPTPSSLSDARAWLSGVLTNHVTCSDAILAAPILDDLISRCGAALAVLGTLSEHEEETSLRGNLPPWVTAADGEAMRWRGAAAKADLTVAVDGSGNYKNVGDAIAAAPEKSKRRYVIYVKKGTYKENIEVGKSKNNLMIIGDGMDSTIITGHLNVVDGSTTFKSATLAAVGEGFILQDICIQNTAGPEKHQAVALRVGADKSIINRCRIEAYQDTLYTHSLRQFYRDTYVRGTVDFIFGNAAVVFQKCTLEARKPMSGQKNMVTAQGRTDPNQNTGTSIQDSEIKAGADLEPVKSSFPTYLGRPWKEYSRTVVMQSYIWDVIDPAGWAEWSGDFAKDTLYYGEYMNRGTGAGTSERVKWKGYHVITSSDEAMKFTVKEMIQGGEWIGSAGVTFTEGL